MHFAHKVFVREQEVAKVQRVGVSNNGNQEVASAVGAFNVNGEPQSDVLVSANTGRTFFVDGVNERGVHRGYGVDASNNGVGNQVRKGDFGARRTRQRFVQRSPIDLEEARRHRAHAGRGGHRETRIHVGDNARGRAP